MSREKSESQLARELEEARSQLEEYKETLRAIRSGEVDALLVSTDVGDRVFKLEDKTYRLLFETLNEGTLTLSSDGSILYSNKAFADLVGAPLENVIGKPIFEFTSDKDVVGGYLDRTLLGTNLKDVEIELLNAGVQVTCEASTALLKDEDDIPQAVIVTIRDVSDRKRLENELRDREASEYAQNIVNTVREPLVVLDDKLRVVSANRSFYSTFDVTPEMSENVLLFDLGNGQWNIPKLRELLEEVLPKSTSIEDFEVEHDFPAIGQKTMLINARRIQSETGAAPMILLAIEDITERLRLQRELRESELWYRILVETIPQKVFAKDRDLRIVFANRNFTADFELQDELLGKTDYDLFPRELADGYTADDRQVLESGETMDIEEAYMQDGEEFRVHTVKTPLRDGDGNITGLLGIFWDVTEEKEAQRQLRTTQFESDKAGDMIIRYGPDGRIVYANEAACRRHGYSKEKFLALSVWDVTVDVTEKSFKETWSALMEKGEDRKETEHVCSNGSTFPAEVTLSLLEFEGEVFAFMFGRDTTELERLAEELKKIEWMLQPAGKRSDYIPPYGDVCSLTEGGLLLNKIGRDVLEDIAGEYLDLLETSAVIYEKDGSYAVGIFSSGWCRMLDNASFSLCGTDDLAEALKSGKWLCHESCWTDCSKVSVEEDRPVDIECNGGIHRYAVPIHAFGEVVGSANIGYGAPPKELKEIAERYGLDADELKEAALKYRTYPQFMIDLAKRRLELSADFMGVSLERKLAEEASIENAERARCLNAELQVHVEALESLYEELDSFSYSISHDLRAPLRAIEGFSAMLMEDHRESLDNEGQRLLGVVSEQTQKMGDLIDGLLRFSRTSREDLTLGPVDMRALCGEVVAECESRTGDRDVTFNVEELPPAIGDYRMLKQVFENLIGNAVKFTGTREKAVIDVGFQPEEWGTNYFVGDNGVGFNMEYAGNIFGVFQRYHSEKEFEGTGIGLSLVQRIVAKHGGKVRAEAEEDKGATFYFSLPQREEG